MSDKRGKTSKADVVDETIVSRAFEELKQDGPPPHLDEKILAEARRVAADPGNVVIEVQRWRRWTLPVALAATVVFAVPLVIRVFELGPTGFDRAPAVTGKLEAARPASSERAAEQPARDKEFAELQNFESRRPSTEPMLGVAPAPAPESADQMVFQDDLGKAAPATTAEPESLSREQLEIAAAEFAGPAPDAEQTMPSVEDSAVDESRLSRFSRTGDESVFATPPETAPAERKTASRTSRPGLTGPAQSRADNDSLNDAAVAASEETDYSLTAAEVSLASGIADDGQDRAVAPGEWLDRIAAQYRQGQVQDARNGLGTFLAIYPEYPIPGDFPLAAEDALYDARLPDGGIVPEAGAWLRGIGQMAGRGQTDEARTELARFFRVYPDYPLPADFPLTRADAEPIER